MTLLIKKILIATEMIIRSLQATDINMTANAPGFSPNVDRLISLFTLSECQDEYLAIGIGDDKIDVVRNYIANHSNS